MYITLCKNNKNTNAIIHLCQLFVIFAKSLFCQSGVKGESHEAKIGRYCLTKDGFSLLLPPMNTKLLKALFFLVSLLLAFLFGYNDEPQEADTQQEVFVDSPEIPQLQRKLNEQIVRHEGFTVSYNADYRIANWTAYELTAEKVKSNVAQRFEVFQADPKVKGKMATDFDYRRSGYDRGHLVPAGDMKWSKKAMEASFYYSNICPQNRELNSGLWHELEKKCRGWAVKREKLLIVTGPVIEKDMKRLGENHIAVPKQFYKVVYSVSGKGVEGIGFIFENRNYTNTSLRTLALPIDSVEKVAGIDFYPSLPADARHNTESIINLSYWEL